MWGALLGGLGAGLVKGDLDKDQQKKDAKLQAAIAQYSPWTGMQAQAPKQADMFGSALQGAGAGAALGQGLDQSSYNKDYLEYLKQRDAAKAAGGGVPMAGQAYPGAPVA